jgi:hypothetical protein
MRTAVIAFLLTSGIAPADEMPTLADPDTQAARRHFQEGADLYSQGRWADALQEFTIANSIRPAPAFEFNIARCEDRLEHWTAAADAYDRYLREPTTDDADLRARVAVLRARATPSLVIVQAPARPFARRHAGSLAAGGAGAALLAGALAAGIVAHARFGALGGACAADGACDAAGAPDAQGWIDSGQRAALVSDALLVVGVVVVAAAIVVAIVEWRHR